MAKKEAVQVPTLDTDEIEFQPPPAKAAPPLIKAPKDPREPGKVYAKLVQMGLGVDLLGSKMSLSAKRDSTLEVTSLGIKATSGKNGRVVLVPWANIRGVELFTD